MIDRVAQAILTAFDKEEAYMKGAIDFATIDGSVDLRVIARAAIEAIREPTDAMLDAYTAAASDENGPHAMYLDSAGYRAMIDAALATEPAE